MHQIYYNIKLALKLQNKALYPAECATGNADAVSNFERIVHKATLFKRGFQHPAEVFHLLVRNHHHPVGGAVLHIVRVDPLEVDEVQGNGLGGPEEHQAGEERLFHHLATGSSPAPTGGDKSLHAQSRQAVPDSKLCAVAGAGYIPICRLGIHFLIGLKLLSGHDAQERQAKDLGVEPNGVVAEVVKVQVQTGEHLFNSVCVAVI